MSERWRKIKGFPGYAISSHGRVKTHWRILQRKRKLDFSYCKILVPWPTSRWGHLAVFLFKEGKRKTCLVHRLVLEAFVGPCPKGKQTRHMNGKTDRNFLNNLKWGTHLENARDRGRHGTQVRGVSHPCTKTSEKKVLKIRELLQRGVRQDIIAKSFNISQALVSLIKHKKHWTDSASN